MDLLLTVCFDSWIDRKHIDNGGDAPEVTQRNYNQRVYVRDGLFRLGRTTFRHHSRVDERHLWPSALPDHPSGHVQDREVHLLHLQRRGHLDPCHVHRRPSDRSLLPVQTSCHQ